MQSAILIASNPPTKFSRVSLKARRRSYPIGVEASQSDSHAGHATLDLDGFIIQDSVTSGDYRITRHSSRGCRENCMLKLTLEEEHEHGEDEEEEE
jgi:hypothetical protein